MRGLPAVAFATGEGGHAAEDRMLHVWAWRADADEAHGGSPSEARREARTLTPWREGSSGRAPTLTLWQEARTLTPWREGSNPIPTTNPNPKPNQEDEQLETQLRCVIDAHFQH